MSAERSIPSAPQIAVPLIAMPLVSVPDDAGSPPSLPIEADPRRLTLAHILRRLARSGSYLIAGPSHGGRQDYQLIIEGTAKTGRVTGVPAELVADALQRGLISRVDRRCVLSKAGGAWVRRDYASGDAFRAQHQSLEARALPASERVTGPALFNLAESPLGWLRRRKDKAGVPIISDAQFDAGERLRADFTFALMSPRVTSNWDSTGGRCGKGTRGGNTAAQMRDTTVAAKERVNHALRAVGPELSSILVDVCCHLKGLEDVQEQRDMPPRSAKLFLLKALSALSRHYGLVPAEQDYDPIRHVWGMASAGDEGKRVASGDGQNRRWGSPDYRPTLEAWRTK